jgi:hypothetical protein
MKSILLTLTVLFSTSVLAADIKILSWYRLNSDSNNDSAAEVCFSLKPAPEKPVFAEITIDKGSRVEGLYSAWIGPKGSTCHIVSTARGRVQVEVPALHIKSQLLQY